MRSLYPLTLALGPVFSSFSGVFQEILQCRFVCFEQGTLIYSFLYFSSKIIDPHHRNKIQCTLSWWQSLSAFPLAYFLYTFTFTSLFKWQRWPKGMILRTPPLTITRLHFERMKSIPFASKYENIRWLGIYKDKKIPRCLLAPKRLTFICIRFVVTFSISGRLGVFVFFFFPPHSQTSLPDNSLRHIKFRKTHLWRISFICERLTFYWNKKAAHLNKI